MALVSKRTVLSALGGWPCTASWKSYGTVHRQGMLGPRTVQTSNAYLLTFPKGLDALAANVVRLGHDGNNCTPSDLKGREESSLRGSEFEFAAPPPSKPQLAEFQTQEASLNWRDRARAAIGKAPLREEL